MQIIKYTELRYEWEVNVKYFKLILRRRMLPHKTF